MAPRLRDVLVPFQIVRRLVMAFFRWMYTLIRVAYVPIGMVYATILRIMVRGKSLCASVILALRVVTVFALKATVLVILFCFIKISTKIKTVVSTLVLRIAVFMAKPYRYQPLDQPAAEIRLLRVRSCAKVWGVPGTMLVKADLISVPIADPPTFAAISYRWTYSRTVPSLIGRGKFAMSTSIYELLCSLQSDPENSQEEQLYWIDSICINQADINEKACQIGLMRDIYRSASRVIGWLGSDAPPVSEWGGLESALSATILISNDFFFRVWIIQEMALASKVIMRTKHDACSWDEGVFERLRTSGSSFTLYGENQMGIPASMMTRLGQGINNLKSMDSFRDLLKDSPSGVPLYELLVRSAEFDCTDPRDRIFGLLGLTTETARSAIQVNYADSYPEINASVQAVMLSIQEESSFELLELSGIGLNASHPFLTDRPSWIPAWNAAHIPKARELILHGKSHKTGTHLPSKIGASESGILSDRLLRIEGAIVDSVEYIMTLPWHLPKLSDEGDDKILSKVAQFLDQLDMVCRVARGDDSPPSGVPDAPDAILRTIIHGGSKQQPEQPNLEEVRKTLEMVSQRLRGRLASPDYRKNLHGSVTHMDYMHFIMYLEELMPLVIGRRLCTTQRGRFAMIPAFSEVGDKFIMLSGARNPFVIRPYNGERSTNQEGRSTYQLVGSACVDGIMEGQLQGQKLSVEMLHIK